jgi:hypothetical protein
MKLATNALVDAVSPGIDYYLADASLGIDYYLAVASFAVTIPSLFRS